MGWTDCTLCSVQGWINMKSTLDGWRSAGEPRAPVLGLFVYFFQLCSVLPSLFRHHNKHRWKKEKKRRAGQRGTVENLHFSIHSFCTSGEVRVNTQLMADFVFNYSDCLKIWGLPTGCFVRCHHALSLVMIQRRPALQITTLVCWSASWLIVSRPPNAQHEACHIIVFFYYCVCCK